MKKISNKEFIWYLCCGIVATFGIILVVFGIIGNNMVNTPLEENFVRQFEIKNNLNLRFLGILFIAIGVLVAVIALMFNAKKADRDIEKKVRREQRLTAQAAQNIEVKKAVEIIEEPAETK